jgi:hypothetical protein
MNGGVLLDQEEKVIESKVNENDGADLGGSNGDESELEFECFLLVFQKHEGKSLE